MKKFLIIVSIAGLAYAAWKHWQAHNAETADLWATATDSLD